MQLICLSLLVDMGRLPGVLLCLTLNSLCVVYVCVLATLVAKLKFRLKASLVSSNGCSGTQEATVWLIFLDKHVSQL